MGSPIRNSDPNTNHKVKLNSLDEVPHFRDVEDKKRFLDIASIFTFCLRCFSGLIHRNIVNVLKCFTVPMSSTLSLNGLKLIRGKHGGIYDRFLMMIYLDKNNYRNVIA